MSALDPRATPDDGLAERPPTTRAVSVKALTWIGIALSTIWLLVGVVNSGFPGALIGAGTIALFTAIYVLVSGRRSWLLIPSRKAGALLLGAGLVVSLLGGGLSPKAPQQHDGPLADNAQVTASAPPTSRPPESPRPDNGLATSRPTSSPTPTAKGSVVTTKEVVVVEDVPFTQSSVDDPNLAAGTSQVTTPGVAGKKTVTYRVTLTDGVETSRSVVHTIVTIAAVTQITATGTHVAPVAPAAPPPAPPPAPATITPGAFCADGDVGTSALGANGRTYVCGSKGADANGHYHWNR